MPRQPVNNLIPNWNFENAPTFVAPTNTGSRFIDGTAGGSVSTGPQKWWIANGFSGNAEARYDPTVSRTGGNSLKLSTTNSSGAINVALKGTISGGGGDFGNCIPVLPNTSYTLSGWVKTNNVASGGAKIEIREYDVATNVTGSNASSTLTGTNDWTFLTVTVTTASTTRAISPILRNNVTGNISDAWFDDLRLDLTANTTRPAATNRLVVRDMKAGLAVPTAGRVEAAAASQTCTTGFTAAIWVKFDVANLTLMPTATPRLVRTTDDAIALFVNRGSGTVDLKLTTTQGTSPRPGILWRYLRPGEWNHITATYDATSTKARLYANGVFITEATRDGTNLICNDTWSVGDSGGTQGLAGKAANVRIYNRALTDAEIGALYYNGTAPSDSRVLTWKLDEGAGTTANDSSGNGNTGTITGATYTSDTPMKARQLVGGNLVRNGDFEYAPPFVAATTGGAYIDGTSGGSSTNSLFEWANFSAGGSGTRQVQFDSVEKHSGSNSLKLSIISAGGSVEAQLVPGNSASDYVARGIPVLPNTSYTLSFWMKTNRTSGSSASGARMLRVEKSATATTTSSVIGNVLTTTPWTFYTETFITGPATRFLMPRLSCTGSGGSADLIMDAWFDDIVLTPTTAITRPLVT